jgi:hypothetical protein
VAGNKIRQVSE